MEVQSGCVVKHNIFHFYIPVHGYLELSLRGILSLHETPKDLCGTEIATSSAAQRRADRIVYGLKGVIE